MFARIDVFKHLVLKCLVFIIKQFYHLSTLVGYELSALHIDSYQKDYIQGSFME